MKYNEHLRPRGIGRSQLAFPTGSPMTELQSLEIDFQDIAQESIGSQIDEKVAQAIGIAKSSATASASEAHKRAQNYAFGMHNILNFQTNSTTLAQGIGINYATANVVNSNFHRDNRDRFIYVNEAGWYWVNAFFYSNAISGNHDYALSVTTNVSGSGYDEDYAQFFAVCNTNKNPFLNGSTIINLPSQYSLLNKEGRYGFRINLHTTAGVVTFTPSNTMAQLQVFKLSDLFEANRTFIQQV